VANPLIKDRPAPIAPAGEGKGAWMTALQAGAKLLQDRAPLKGFDAYVVGFHCARHDPDMQMEAHHYCKVVNDDFLQCLIFDGNTAEANLIGIEYIVSERLFETLPEEEKGFWHPHNFELLSGQLVAPGLPEAAELALMERLMNSYGKTWHTWHTGRHDGHDTGTTLPLGEPALMWSFNGEGECDERLKEDRSRAMDVDVEDKRRRRQGLVDRAHPQRGVDAMRGDFALSEPVPGVVDAGH
jgi:uncharacterized protein DUF1264